MAVATTWHHGLGSNLSYYAKVRYQRFPWLPGNDSISVQIEEDEYQRFWVGLRFHVEASKGPAILKMENTARQ